jgi:hypothetical protein
LATNRCLINEPTRFECKSSTSLIDIPPPPLILPA